jgi:hypothetical protein
MARSSCSLPRVHSSEPISLLALSRYLSTMKSLVYRCVIWCGGGNNAGLALRRINSIAGRDVRRRREADHECDV